MVLQAGQHEPSVRHALAAIGSLHEKLLAGSIVPSQPQDNRTRFALEQCNKSIQHLVKPESTAKTKPNLRLMLTTCVLFTCFEALQGHCEQAIIHATQGYSLLQQYAVDPDSSRWDVGAFAVELDQLCLLMRRLQTQSKGLMVSMRSIKECLQTVRCRKTDENELQGKDFNMVSDADTIQSSTLPTKFTDLREARSSLEMALNQLTVFFMDLELDDQFYDLAISNAEKHLIFSPWLSAWEKALSAYLSENQPRLGVEDRKAAMVLKAHHLVAEVLSEVDLSLGELGWDAFKDKVRGFNCSLWLNEPRGLIRSNSLQPSSSSPPPSSPAAPNPTNPSSKRAGNPAASSSPRPPPLSPSAWASWTPYTKFAPAAGTPRSADEHWTCSPSTPVRNAYGVRRARGKWASF